MQIPGIFYKTSYGCMCKSYCFFGGGCLLFFLVAQKRYMRWFWHVVFEFIGHQNFKVNNLATSRSITWPHFWPKCWRQMWPGYWPWSFHMFFYFFFVSHSPCRKKKIKNTKKQTNEIKVARLLTYGGQIIDLQHICCMYIYIYICML